MKQSNNKQYSKKLLECQQPTLRLWGGEVQTNPVAFRPPKMLVSIVRWSEFHTRMTLRFTNFIEGCDQVVVPSTVAGAKVLPQHYNQRL